MDDSGIPPEAATAFLALKRDYTHMVNQGMSRAAIAVTLKRRVWQQRFAEELPADKIAYCIKLALAGHK
jgi:hypothetical protein